MAGADLKGRIGIALLQVGKGMAQNVLHIKRQLKTSC